LLIYSDFISVTLPQKGFQAFRGGKMSSLLLAHQKEIQAKRLGCAWQAKAKHWNGDFKMLSTWL
jgi:hypothetical protein